MAQNLRTEYIQSVLAKNKVKIFQRKFPVNEVPVFLKTKLDNRVYRGVMVGSVLGIALSGLFIGMMATNTMPKKEKS